MSKIIEGSLDAAGFSFALVVSRFNDIVSKGLLAGAMDGLKRHGAKDADITLSWVPGAFEIPIVAQKLAQTKKYDAIICLGAVIRGSTPHFDYVASEASKGIAKISLELNIPVIFGILTCDTLEQALERSGAKEGNKGFSAAQSAIEMVNIFAQIK